MKAILLILMNVILKFISRSFLQDDKMLEMYTKKYHINIKSTKVRVVLKELSYII